jgi:general secretion pathway protein G
MLTGRKFAAITSDAKSRAVPTAANRAVNTRNSAPRNQLQRVRDRGFTMLELMVVMAIILILLGMAAGRYQRSIQRSREAVMKQDLHVMRDAIQQFTLDKLAAPQSLDDLVSAGYLRQVPTDPITQARDWTTVSEDVLLSPEQTTVGISDVHSASNEISPFENTAYSSW